MRRRFTLFDLAVMLAVALMLLAMAGCSTAKIEVIEPTGRTIRGEAASCLQKLELADAHWRTTDSPTTRSSDVGIGSLKRDQTEVGKAMIELGTELMKKAP